MDKDWQFWAAVAGTAFYVALRDAEAEVLWRRVAKTAAAALLGVGLAPTISPWLNDNETLAACVVMAFGITFLDMANRIFGDGEFIKDIIRSRLGVETRPPAEPLLPPEPSDPPGDGPGPYDGDMK